MNKRGIEALVGLFVVLGLLGLLFLAMRAANLTTIGNHASYVVRAKFDNIGGLKARAPVRSAGVTVGGVTSISLDPTTYQDVDTLDIDKRFEFPADSSATILTCGLLGAQYLVIETGPSAKTRAG